MSHLKLIVRKELSMPRGKMGAQVAHAAIKLCLEQMTKFQGSVFMLPEKQVKELRDWLSNPYTEVIMVKGEKAMQMALVDEQPAAVIIDNGRTHFHGERTLTCAAQGIFSVLHPDYQRAPNEFLPEKSRQYYLISDEHHISKQEVCEMTVRLGLQDLLGHMYEGPEQSLLLDRSSGTALGDWLEGAFTKICLKTDTDQELNYCATKLVELGFAVQKSVIGNHLGLCIEPAYSEDLQPLLVNFRPLMGW